MRPHVRSIDEDILDHYATAVCFELNLRGDDFRRVRDFIGCNGYPLTHSAAREARRAIDEGRLDLDKAWPYAVAVFNRGLAACSHLYTLLYLVETSLRAWINRRMWAVAGATWYHDLASRSRVDADAAESLMHQFGHRARLEGRPTELRDLERPVFQAFESPETFLDALTLRNLCHFVRLYYRKEYGGFFMHPPAYTQPVWWNQLKSPLYDLRDVRNDVAHARRVLRPDEFTNYADQAGLLLGYMRFDTARTIQRVEVARYDETLGVSYLRTGYLRGLKEIAARAEEDGSTSPGA